MQNFSIAPDKVEGQKLSLEANDHIIVDNTLWRVVQNLRSMGSPSQMLVLAYHTHREPRSYKFHAVRPEERFEVYRPIV